MAKNILITGASGLIGTRLTEILLERGYHVSHLGRKKKPGAVPSFVWDVEKGQLDQEAIMNADVIVHLAGAGVAEKRWTESRKKEILKSRTHSAALLVKSLSENKHHIASVISASGIGYYGIQETDKFLTEENGHGNDFLAEVTRHWEEAVDQFTLLNLRVVKLRIGIVLSEKGGALKSMALPIQLGIGSPLASGNQYLSWIHIDDLCEMFINAIQDESMQGAYNACGVNPVTNKELIRAIATVLKKPLWAPRVPSFVLKLVLGEMAEMVIYGNKISSQKIQETGFKFKFPDLKQALYNLFKVEKNSNSNV
jgi:uncharacterized protein (TIGR01777 family)